jgi:hypothetical protein
MWKKPYYDKLQVSQVSRRLFQYSKKILCRFQLREVGSHVSIWTTQSKSPDAHQSVVYYRKQQKIKPLLLKIYVAMQVRVDPRESI